MEEEEEGKRPWWDRALDPLRHEASMFNVLLGVVLAAAVLIAVVLAVRALT